MESNIAVGVLTALAQETRLEAFRTLVKHEPSGVAAGELARLLDVPQNTLSSHLTILTNAQLVKSARHGRSIIYRANLDAVHELVLHLLKECCNGNPELCAPLAKDILACASSTECC